MQKPFQEFAQVGTNVPEFSLDGKEMYGRIVSLYDGDTMTAIIPLFGSYYKYPIRLRGIDTAEMKSKILENKRKAIRARNMVLQWLLPNRVIQMDEAYTKKHITDMLAEDVALVWIKCGEFEKFGRLLADVYYNFKDPEDMSFSNRLIREGLAYEYQGGTKLTEDEQVGTLIG